MVASDIWSFSRALYPHALLLIHSFTQIQLIKATLELVILAHLFYLLLREQKFHCAYVCIRGQRLHIYKTPS